MDEWLLISGIVESINPNGTLYHDKRTTHSIVRILGEKSDPNISIPVTYARFPNREVTSKEHSLRWVTDFWHCKLYAREMCLALYRVRNETLHVYNVNSWKLKKPKALSLLFQHLNQIPTTLSSDTKLLMSIY